MIKVNLIATERDRAVKKPRFDVGQQLTAMCGLILVAAALGIGWWFWSLNRQSAEIDREIAAAEAETTRLQNIIQQVQQFEARRSQLQQRVTLIEQLRKGQTGPVHLLDEISRALPESMWLVELKQAGNDITIDGRCTTLNALSDFVSALEASNLFATPVEIIDSRVEQATAGNPELIRFSVKARVAEAPAAATAN